MEKMNRKNSSSIIPRGGVRLWTRSNFQTSFRFGRYEMRLYHRRAALTLIAMLFFSTAARSQENSDPTNLPERRTANLAQPILIGSLLLGTVALRTEDGDMRRGTSKFLKSDFSQDLELNDLGNRGTLFEQLGAPLGAAGTVGVFYLTGVLTGSEKSRRVGVLAFEAWALNAVVNSSIKGVVGRERPNRTDDTDVYRPFSGQGSFPSGHTSSAFALATVVAANYDSVLVKSVSFGLAVLVGAGRVAQNEHWTSDVIAGAVVGCSVGTFINRYEKRTGKSRRFYATPTGIGMEQRF